MNRVLFVGRAENNRGRFIKVEEVPRRLQPVHPRHADIEQHEIRFGLPGQPDSFDSVCRIVDNFVPIFILQHAPQPVARESFIVN